MDFIVAWVREVLRSARGRGPADPAKKLAAIRAAARYSFPTGEIDEVLAQIERGYARSEGRGPSFHRSD